MRLRSFIIAVLASSSALALAAPQPPALRLGRDVVPEHMWLDLTLTPDKTDFSGKVEMDLRINRAVDYFWLNATRLSLTNPKIEINGRTVNAQVIPGNEDFVGFQFPSALQPGKAHFSVSFTGQVNLRSSEGIFRNSYKGDNYLFTQFESISARTAFPCFDEPDFKIPWNVTLRVPQKDVADANTMIQNETPDANGMKTVSFAETKPLPSYLVAFAVGPLQFVDAGTIGTSHVPVRIVVPHGEQDRAKYAASVTAIILTRLEEYFAIPYPFDKADQVAIPLSFGGAMENPGLVTYDSDIILSPPGQDTVRHQREYASIAAHELAHQWTGDLVTMEWWNDTWLNESFATWMSARLLAHWKPEWHTLAEDQTARLLAIKVDTQTSARRITQPINTKNDIANAFDGITYEKGGQVLAMFENAVGPQNFRSAVHNYLEAHKFGNATAQDFLSALGAATKPEYARAFATFLDQTGVPEVKTQLRCGQDGHASLDVEQQRLLPLGSSGDPNRTWGVPVCIASSSGSGRKVTCQLVTQQRATVTLPDSGCPAWYLANDKEVGYYEVIYANKSLSDLLDHRNNLTLAEQVGMLGDLHLLATDGHVSWDQTLALVPKLKDDARPEILEAAIRLATIPDHYLDPNLKPKYASFVDEVFGPRARQLGWLPKPGDTPDEQLLRPQLVKFVAYWGNDAQLINEAKRLANEWLENHNAVPPDVAGSVLAVAARNSGADFYDKVVAAAKAANDPYFKPMLISVLGDFQQPDLVERTLAMVFNGTFDMRMSIRVIAGVSQNPVLAKMAYQYVKQHYDQIVAKLPRAVETDYAAYLPYLAVAAACSDTAESEARTFFEPRMTKVIGGPRNLSQALEQIHLCAAAKPTEESQIATFLSAYPAKEAAAGAAVR